jgi:nucleotide-binding universal stress UspA family protein
MKRILTITDFSKAGDTAILYGSALANQFNSDLLLCHMVDIPEIGLCEFQWSPIQYLDRTIHDANEYLEKFIKSNNIAAEIIIKTHCNIHVIPNLVREKNTNIVIVPSDIKSGFKNWIHKHVTGKSARSIACPILAVPYLEGVNFINEQGYLRFDKILIGCKSIKNMSKIIRSIWQISEKFSSELHFFFVLNQTRNVSEIQTQIHQKITKAMNQFTPANDSDSNKSFKIIMENGSSSGKLLQYAKNQCIDMICLDSYKDANSKRNFKKFSSKRIISKSQCPVLVTRSNPT